MIDTVASLAKSIQVKQEEQIYLLRVLELWAAAEAQGIDSSGGGAFGLDTRLFTEKQRREWHRYRDRFIERFPNGASRPKLYNYFHCPDGRIITLNPMLEAVHHA